MSFSIWTGATVVDSKREDIKLNGNSLYDFSKFISQNVSTSFRPTTHSSQSNEFIEVSRNQSKHFRTC